MFCFRIEFSRKFFSFSFVEFVYLFEIFCFLFLILPEFFEIFSFAFVVFTCLFEFIKFFFTVVKTLAVVGDFRFKFCREFFSFLFVVFVCRSQCVDFVSALLYIFLEAALTFEQERNITCRNFKIRFFFCRRCFFLLRYRDIFSEIFQ